MFCFTVIFFTTIFNLFSQTAAEWKKLGNVEFDSANYNKAIEYYQKAIEIDSTYIDAYHNIGLTFYHTEEFDKAIVYFNKVIAITDTSASTYFLLGGLYEQKQDFDKAIEMVKKGIFLQPNSSEEYNFLSFLYSENHNEIYAMHYAKKAAQLGDTLAQQFFIDNEMSWENNFAPPDYERIKWNIKNKKSNFYYAKLWNRYQQGDNTMSLEEKRHLYYGYVFHKNYSPYSSAHNDKQINAILNNEEPTQKEWEKLLSLLNVSLSVEPFSCQYLFYQCIAYEALGKAMDAAININKIWNIVDALNSTGDGLSKETAIHVIAISNEYDYLFLNELSRKSQALVIGGFDVLELMPNEDGLEELWFDINQPFNSLKKTFK